jgi:hypothetical protein
MKNVYHIDQRINKLKDGRVNPKYKTRRVVLPLLLGFLLRIKSMNELKFMLFKLKCYSGIIVMILKKVHTLWHKLNYLGGLHKL